MQYARAVPIRIVVVDDHPIVLQGLENLFQRQRDIQVVACADNANAALDIIREERPDIALDRKSTRLNSSHRT